MGGGGVRASSTFWQHLTPEMNHDLKHEAKSEVYSWRKAPGTICKRPGESSCLSVHVCIHHFVCIHSSPSVSLVNTMWLRVLFSSPKQHLDVRVYRGVREDISGWVWSFPRIKNPSRLLKWEEFHDNPAPRPKHSCVSSAAFLANVHLYTTLGRAPLPRAASPPVTQLAADEPIG